MWVKKSNYERLSDDLLECKEAISYLRERVIHLENRIVSLEHNNICSIIIGDGRRFVRENNNWRLIPEEYKVPLKQVVEALMNKLNYKILVVQGQASHITIIPSKEKKK